MAISNPRIDAQWLYRQGDLVLGPVDPGVIEEMLFAGTLSGQAEIAPLGSNTFRPAGEVELFRVTVAKAEARLRVQAAEKAHDQARRKQTALRLGVLAAVGLLLLGGAVAGARYLAVHGSFGSDAEALITVEPPTISLARSSARASEVLLAYGSDEVEAKPPPPKLSGLAAGQEATPPGAVAAATPKAGSTPSARKTPRPPKGSPTQQPAAATGTMAAAGGEADGLEMGSIDQGAINAVVASRQKTLHKCLQIVARAKPGQRTRIPIEFVIGNEGRVAQLWIDHPDFKTGELHACMLGELKKWPFKSYSGEQATVNLAFNVG